MTGQQQSAIRLALAMCAADKTSEMTHRERQWVIDRLQEVNSEGGYPDLDDGEVALIRTPLLSWAYTRDVAFGKQLQAHLEGGAIPQMPRRSTSHGTGKARQVSR